MISAQTLRVCRVENRFALFRIMLFEGASIMNLASWVERNGRLIGDRPAIAVGTTTYATHRQMAGQVRAIAGYLRGKLGCVTGERVGIISHNNARYLGALFGIWHAGLVAVPINSRLHAREFEYILQHSDCRVAFVEDELAQTVASIAGDCAGLKHTIVLGDEDWRAVLAFDGIDLTARAGSDHAWLFYTSGTTGRPKGACLTHRNLLIMSLAYFADIDPISPQDGVLHAAPLSHGSGLYGLPHIARGAVSILPESGGFAPDEIGALLQSFAGVSFFAAPTMVKRLMEHKGFAAQDHRNLKTIIYGGAPMYLEDLRRALDVVGPKLAQIYGQGESPMNITALPKAVHADTTHSRWIERMMSVGTPRTDVEVRLADADDRDVPQGEAGEVLVRGDVVMAGYFGDEAATAAALRGGWLHTGDVGAFDAEGFLTLKDRVKDMIISGGSNIYPREIEEVLLRHPTVQEVSVFGLPDPEWGENVIAAVVLRPGATADEGALDTLCIAEIARFKRPKRYVFVSELPKNNYGKILKTRLREDFRPG
jgi:acyl-CoA synthetase (AMP-forming)/AMP-acid ligase II